MFQYSWPRARRVRRRATDALGLVTALFRSAGFWTAVALPLAYLPLLVAPAPTGSWTLLPSLLGAHAVALVVGHGYAPGELGDRVPAGRATGQAAGGSDGDGNASDGERAGLPEWHPLR
jgi:hypothetical protein